MLFFLRPHVAAGGSLILGPIVATVVNDAIVVAPVDVGLADVVDDRALAVAVVDAAVAAGAVATEIAAEVN